MQEALGSGPITAIALITALLSGGICLQAAAIGARAGILDAPDGRRKIHPTTTPLVGGLAVMVPVLVVLAVLAATSEFTPLHLTLLLSATACLLLGLRDDRRHIRPLYRLVLSSLLAGAVFWAVPALEVTFLRFSFVDSAQFLGPLALPFSILCVVGLQNAVNMADGKNGIVIGLSLIWTGNLAVFAPEHLKPLLLVLAVALAVTLLFNLRGRLFLGDSGSYSISFLMALLVIYVYGVGFVRLPADLVALWFLVPVVDCLRLMGRRALRGGSPFTSDRNHLHHVLYERFPWRWGLLVYLGIAGLPGLLASFWPSTTVLWALVSLVCYGIALYLPVRVRSDAGLHAR